MLKGFHLVLVVYREDDGYAVLSSESIYEVILRLCTSRGERVGESDCYYEDEGLDCDNENAHTSNNSYIHIRKLVFCITIVYVNTFLVRINAKE